MAEFDYETRKYVRPVKAVTMALSIIGAINWGLVSLFDFDLVEALAGRGKDLKLRDRGRHVPTHFVARLIYGLVGLAGFALAIAGPIKAIPYTRRTIFEKRPMTMSSAREDYLH